ncbi:hypothetical protein KQI65_11875 [bacterium]|nr:hypothetical protein [bacterium]
MESFLHTLFEHPILGVVLVSLIVSLVFTIVRKLFKVAVGLAVIIIALAIVMHYFGYDSLPKEGKEVLQKAEEMLP